MQAPLRQTLSAPWSIYLRDIGDAEEVAKAHLEIFDNIRPASTLVQVTSMLRSWFKRGA
jgi:hypothetical protein